VLLHATAHQQVEFLIGAAKLDIGLESNRVVALSDRVEELMDGYRLLRSVALGEIVALEHTGDGKQAGQPGHLDCRHFSEPLHVEAQLGLLPIEHLENLVGVGAGVGFDILAGHRLSGGVLATGVADHPGEVADQEDDRVAHVLELAHLVEQHGVADVQVGRGRIEARLDPQWPADAQSGFQLLLFQYFLCAPMNQRQRVLQIGHGSGSGNSGAGTCRPLVKVWLNKNPASTSI